MIFISFYNCLLLFVCFLLLFFPFICIVRSPYLVTSIPCSSKKPKFSSPNIFIIEGGGAEGGSDDGDCARPMLQTPTLPNRVPHSSVSTFVQPLMKVHTFFNLCKYFISTLIWEPNF